MGGMTVGRMKKEVVFIKGHLVYKITNTVILLLSYFDFCAVSKLVVFNQLV